MKTQVRRFSAVLLAILLLWSYSSQAQVWKEWVAYYDSTSSSWDQPYDIALDQQGYVYVTGEIYDSLLGPPSVPVLKYNSNGLLQWTTYHPYFAGRRVAVDISNNIIVTGIGSEESQMERITTIKYNALGVEQWVATYDVGQYINSDPSSLALDKSGNVYVGGSCPPSWDANCNLVTIKYDSMGLELWSATYPGPGTNLPAVTDLAVDDSGNVYVTGGTENSSEPDYVTIKYSPWGVQLWAACYNSPINSSDYARALALDLEGNIYITGQSHWGGTIAGYHNIVTIKYDPAGNQQWIAVFDGGQSDDGRALVSDGQGHVYVAGAINMPNYFENDYGIIKYDSLGQELWVVVFTNPYFEALFPTENDVPFDMAVDEDGDVYVTGKSVVNDRWVNCLTVKYNQSGVWQWAVKNGIILGTWTLWPVCMAVNQYKDVYVAGTTFLNDYTLACTIIKYNQYTGPEIYPWSLSLPFGNFAVGDSAAIPLVITNPGDTTLILYSLTNADPHFSTDYNPADSLLDPGDSLVVLVTFAPTDTVAYFDTLRIEDNDEPVAIPLSGTGVLPGGFSQPTQNLPQEFALLGAHPNPFNLSTVASFELRVPSYVSLRVYDTAGRLVETLVDGWREAGEHRVTFNGAGLAAGVYLLRLEAGTQVATGKMILLK